MFDYHVHTYLPNGYIYQSNDFIPVNSSSHQIPPSGTLALFDLFGPVNLSLCSVKNTFGNVFIYTPNLIDNLNAPVNDIRSLTYHYLSSLSTNWLNLNVDDRSTKMIIKQSSSLTSSTTVRKTFTVSFDINITDSSMPEEA